VTEDKNSLRLPPAGNSEVGDVDVDDGAEMLMFLARPSRRFGFGTFFRLPCGVGGG
jgi:hypothetical protein